MENTKEKKSKLIFNKILQDISSKRLKRGDVLPSEAELSIKYNVGRGSIREAMQVLEFLGVVRKQAGIGTTVEDFSIDSIFNPAGLHFQLDRNVLLQVVEFRGIFEEIIVRMLCKNIEKEDLEEIEEILALNKFHFERNNYKKYSEYDYKFHRALACATHNIVVENIFNMIFPFLRYMTEENIKNPGRLEETLKDHFELVEIIKTKNTKKAKEIIDRHIKHIKGFI
jgi:GntR family transcriptional repressor for pyruvate dehydrogenase complex